MIVIHIARRSIENTGGLESYIKSCTIFQKRQGDSVTIIDKGVTTSTLRQIKKLIVTHQTVHIYVHDPQLIYILLPLRSLCWLTRKNNVKLILVSHGFFFHHKSIWKDIFGDFLLELTKLADFVLATSCEDQKKSKNKKTFLTGNGFNRPKSIIPKKQGQNFIIVSRDSPHKNLIEGIRIFNEVRKLHENAHLAIVCQNASEALQTAASNCKGITLLENISDTDLTILYQKSSFLLAPSTYEGFGRTLIEAAIYGVMPIYRSNFGHDYIKTTIKTKSGFDFGFSYGYGYGYGAIEQDYTKILEYVTRRFENGNLLTNDSELTTKSVEPFYWDQILSKLDEKLR